MAEAIPVYNDLFVFRGLSEDDLKNFVLVAGYVRLTQNDSTRGGNNKMQVNE
ncbi:hypothetical protein KE513_09600 [Oscillospiraceae bacterium Marseille-Q3528]|nr:hypothetical protein [Oscillospiraceae bacterium Marseille-Q3528]